MTLSTLINRPCTLILRTSSGSVDELGNATDTTAEVDTVCEVQPSRSVEAESGATAEAEFIGFFLPGSADDLRASDAVNVPDLGTFEVVGFPWSRRDPYSQNEWYVRAWLSMKAGVEDAS